MNFIYIDRLHIQKFLKKSLKPRNILRAIGDLRPSKGLLCEKLKNVNIYVKVIFLIHMEEII